MHLGRSMVERDKKCLGGLLMSKINQAHGHTLRMYNECFCPYHWQGGKSAGSEEVR